MTSPESAVVKPSAVGPSWRELTGDQWRAFFAAFFGWMMDAFDFSIMTFILIDIQKSFTVDRALAGLLGTVTLAMRLVGGYVSGILADKWGRRLPLILSVLWFSLFACLSGFSTSYAMLFALRALFGIGMGGEWAAGVPLVMETWPPKLRGLASGLMQGGWYWGVLISALVFEYVYPLFSKTTDYAWRVMFWVAIVPALLTLWIRAGVKESPVWLARRQNPKAQPAFSPLRIFRRDLIRTTLHASAVMGAFICSYYAITFWYATFLRQAGLPTLPYFAAFNIGAILGNAVWGRVSESRPGRRGGLSLAFLIAILAIPIYLHGTTTMLLIGAFLMGSCGTGAWGVAPAYLAERFPTDARGVGPGFTYHAGAAIGSAMPLVLGALQDRGIPLVDAMSGAILASCLITVSLVWLAPETRGRLFTANDE
jgi:SHS family lactate transporter-like MFS transporter